MTSIYPRHRFPAQIIQHCVWLYFTFPLSYRDVEKMMLYRGIFVTYEAIRYWCQKFGQVYANEIRRRRPKPGDKWHLDEVMVTIKGRQSYLWRAVDQAGNVLDILMQQGFSILLKALPVLVDSHFVYSQTVGRGVRDRQSSDYIGRVHTQYTCP